MLLTIFWGQSRYPALNEKASMGPGTPIFGLGFENIIEINTTQPYWRQIIATTINWIYTNKQGMTFGILCAAVLMTMWPFILSRISTNRYFNSLVGLMIGTPLGVCVNCAAPIAQGIRVAGGKAETMLAVMMSSPTLNIIAITMLFTMFPLHLAIVKLAFTLIFILIFIPWLSKNEVENTRAITAPPKNVLNNPLLKTIESNQASMFDQSGSWFQSFIDVVITLTKNLVFIIKTTLPFMLLAGFLGAVTIVFLPFDKIIDGIPVMSHLKTLVTMAAIGILGIFLPVPMLFDVIICSILWQFGLPVKYVAVLLFTLGIFSVYPFFLIRNSISKSIAWMIAGTLVILSVVVGSITHKLDKVYERHQQNLILDEIKNFSSGPQLISSANNTVENSEAKSSDELDLTKPNPQQTFSYSQGQIEVYPFIQPSIQQPEFKFKRLHGHELGLVENKKESSLRFLFPFGFVRGIASGDVHNDGWPDVLVTSSTGISLFANQQGKYFQNQLLEIKETENFIYSAALVDLNNDGWLDLFYSIYAGGNFVIYNDKGDFLGKNQQPLPKLETSIATLAPAFADQNQDGVLDVAIGSSSGMRWLSFPYRQGVGTYSSTVAAENYVLLSDANSWKIERLPGIQGETLSTLYTDIDQDGDADLLIGNDVAEPDYYYKNQNGRLELISKQDRVIQHSTTTTMSMTTADIDNNLVPEIYVAQISPLVNGDRLVTEDPRLKPSLLCQAITDIQFQSVCLNRQKINQSILSVVRKQNNLPCLKLDRHAREICLSKFILTKAYRNKDSSYCELFSNEWMLLRDLCYLGFETRDEFNEIDTAIPSVDIEHGNLLLKQNTDGNFTDRAGQFQIAHSGWSWNAKFADLDNDGWQDLFVVNGNTGSPAVSSYYFHNLKGREFIESTEDVGIDLMRDTLAYTYIDYDNDGDLDILTVPTYGPLVAFENTGSKHNSIAIELHDSVGNYYGIGSKIIIHDANNNQQMRELQSSGGYQSFDSPIAYFGTGDSKEIQRIEIIWSTGEKSIINKSLPTNRKYVISRDK